MRRIALALIRLYRKRISPAKKAPCCRFTPTCSRYAYVAISEWGLILGSLLSLFRLLRCQPLFKGGHDPAPRRKRKLIPKTEIFGRDAVNRDEPLKIPYMLAYGRYIEE